MKRITIYPTSINVSEGMTLDDLTVVDGFEELLDFNTPPERCKDIMDAFKSKGINIQVVIVPDGSTDENLISRDDIKKFLDASKSNIQYGIYFEKAMSGKADLPSGMTSNGSAVFLKSKPTVETIGKEATPEEIAAVVALANSGDTEAVLDVRIPNLSEEEIESHRAIIEANIGMKVTLKVDGSDQSETRR